MKFPAAEVNGEANESYVDAATRSVSELCDIDGPNEIVHLQHIPPIMIYGTAERSVLLHLFCAKAPPPPGPLEEADIEDDEDYYDWYTFPRALKALPDLASRLALQTAGHSLNGAATANRVPFKWRKFEGGVFGQELFGGGT